MSVVPGFGGQSFMPSVLDKVEKAAEWRTENRASFLIQMDGGIGQNNAAQCALAGADVLVARLLYLQGSGYGPRHCGNEITRLALRKIKNPKIRPETPESIPGIPSSGSRKEPYSKHCRTGTPARRLCRCRAHHVSLPGKQFQAFFRLFQQIGSQTDSSRFKKHITVEPPKAKYPFSAPLAEKTPGTYVSSINPTPVAPTSSMATSPHNSDRIRVKFLLLVHSHARRPRDRQYGDTLASGPPSFVQGPGTPDTGK